MLTCGLTGKPRTGKKMLLICCSFKNEQVHILTDPVEWAEKKKSIFEILFFSNHLPRHLPKAPDGVKNENFGKNFRPKIFSAQTESEKSVSRLLLSILNFVESV